MRAGGGPIGILVGLAAEARVIERALAGQQDFVLGCSGADQERAVNEAERLLAEGATALVSFGLAGGLDPALNPGDLIVADGIIPPQGAALPTEPTWRNAVMTAIPGARAGPVAGSDAILATTADKRRLFGRTGALAVDTESHAAALAAQRAGLPLLVLRAVADPASRDLPAVARLALNPDGTIRLGAVLRTLLANPQEWPLVARLAVESRAALRSLSRAAGLALLGPG